MLLLVAMALSSSASAADNLKDIALKFNDATASYLIAEKHYKGHGAVQNYEQALQWYTKAAEMGHYRSKLKLGEMYFYGKGTEKNFSAAVKWLREPAEKGQSEAQFLLGLIYAQGEKPAIAKNEVEALYWFKQAAEEYHAEAAYHAGRMYLYGLGDAADAEKAEFYLKLAKDYGDTQAERLLASIAAESQKQTETQLAQSEITPQAQNPKSTVAKSPADDMEQRAQSGEVSAQFRLAESFFHGANNRRIDADAALYWYQQAATNGHAEAQYKLGVLYFDGQFVSKDLNQSRKWFVHAAAQNHGEARQRLAAMDSQRATKSRSASQVLIERAEKGDPDTQFKLAMLYLNGESESGASGNGETQTADKTIARNAQSALKWFVAAAEQGHVGAQFQAGMMYFNPESDENDQAEQWLIKAATGQHPEAQYYLGSLYENQGKLDQAVNWLDRAVEQNHDNALDLLLMLYLDNRVASAEQTKVTQWLEKAAKKGYIEAQYRLGELYLQQNQPAGDEQIARKAYEWLHKAASKGHNQAQYRLALMYQEGIGVSKHYTKSAGWMRRAAESGQVDAQFQLAEMYRLGLGLPKKETLAKKWYQQAAEQGHMEAKLRLSNRARY